MAEPVRVIARPLVDCQAIALYLLVDAKEEVLNSVGSCALQPHSYIFDRHIANVGNHESKLDFPSDRTIGGFARKLPFRLGELVLTNPKKETDGPRHEDFRKFPAYGRITK